jgi:hypothetical protein
MSKSVILNEGLLKHTINTYSSGGYTLLIRNNKSGDMENIPFSSVSPDLAGYPTLDGTQTFTGLNTFNNSVTFANGISIVGGSYAVAATAPTLTASRSIVYPDASGTIALTSDLTAYVPKTRNITINGTTYDLSTDRTWTIVSMIYPSAGIAVSTGTAWGTSITDNSTNWNTAYTNRITSLTTTGSSGAATLTTNTLNIPNYTLSGLGGQAQLNGTGFVKASGTTISYDNSTYLTGITSGQVTTALGFTPYNSTNPSGYITSSSLSSYLPLSGGTMSGTLTLASISGTDQMVENNYGAYLHLGGWGVARTAATAVLVNTAYMADSATSAGYLTGPAATNGSDGWFRSSGSTGWYNSTYTGGIFCQDTSWVRVYNGFGFYVPNQILATSDITAYYSDERLKERKGNITNALEKIKSLDAFYYVNNELAQANGFDNTELQVGFSAQQVKKVLPEIIKRAPFDTEVGEDGIQYSKSGEEYMTLDYGKLTPLIVAAMKEQQSLIDKQQEQIDDLYRQIQFLVENR